MIETKNLCLRLGKFNLNNINLTINDGEYFVILGPTGAGKTIFLESIAGLHIPNQGEIWIQGNNVTHIPPEQRHIGYVPQDYVLFPFLNVRDNITFGIKHNKNDITHKESRLKTLSELVGISHLLDRDTRSLSGGEKQRVAIARALAPNPQILFLDEPFSSLDVQTAKHLRLEIHRIHCELGITTVHITHNHQEAEELGDRIAVMINGTIQQIDQPHTVFFAPQNNTISDFIGSLNILDCNNCRQLIPGLMEVDCSGVKILIPYDEGDLQKIAISPRDVYISDVLPPGPVVNRFKGKIIDMNSMGAITRLTVDMGQLVIKAEMPSDLCEEMNLIIGKEVYIILKLRRLRVLRPK